MYACELVLYITSHMKALRPSLVHLGIDEVAAWKLQLFFPDQDCTAAAEIMHKKKNRRRSAFQAKAHKRGYDEQKAVVSSVCVCVFLALG